MNLPKTPSFRLDGKRALVTGASSGIGLACAVALAQAGAEVIAAARSEDKLAELVSAAQDQGLNMTACALDVSDLDSMTATLGALGRLMFWLIQPVWCLARQRILRLQILMR